jgi:SNF2 family DNA or RNA helicase
MSTPVVTSTVDLNLDVAPYSTGWQTALHRPPRIAVKTTPLDAPRPGVASLPVGSPKIRTYGFTFDVPGETIAAPAAKGTIPLMPVAASDGSNAKRPKMTRVAPPGDIIKLEDRLFYLLQPSLETLMTDAALYVPFQPFGYQMQGIAFLYPRHSAILADEMGLGKTMQAITAIRLLLHAGEMRRILLVCPKPLVTNWQREFALWAPEIPVTAIEGDQAKRRWQWQLSDAPVRLANYEVVVRDREILDELPLPFDLVVLDEAQRIKNRSSTTNQVIRSISRRRSWALTGTPVENSTDDLVGIFEFLSPGYLKPDMKPRRMGQAIGEYVLRRTKDKVLTDLPPKLFRDARVDLTPQQHETYRQAEDEGVLRLTDMGESATIQHVFELVLRLKQICNFDPATGESSKTERLVADLEEVAASGRKAIVFSQWVQTIESLAVHLDRFNPLQYHGKIPSRRRDGVIDEFRNEPDRHVILMSYGAGAVGLNLQFAGYVFLFDRWWNPAVEDQAINRAHRIGASGPVTVSRFLTIGTIEERIDQVLEEKRELFDTIFSGTEPHRNSGMTQHEIFGLFNLRSPQGPVGEAA